MAAIRRDAGREGRDASNWRNRGHCVVPESGEAAMAFLDLAPQVRKGFARIESQNSYPF